MKSRASTVIKLVVVIFIIAILFCALGFSGPLEVAFHVCFGWIAFLVRVLPQIRWDLWSIGTALAALVAAVAIAHPLLRSSLATNDGDSGEILFTDEAPRPPPRVWRFRSTLAAFAGLLCLFVAGISMVGVTHQAAWLATSPEPLLTSGRDWARRSEAMNNLKQIGLSAHNHHDMKKSLPPGAIAADDGQLLHGWLTLLLPYVEQQGLFDQIDLQSPWNSPQNQPPMQTLVRVYQLRHPRLEDEDAAGYPLAHYAANQQVIGGTGQMTLAEIRDGTSNTILSGEVAENNVPWGRPRNWRDPRLGINRSPDGFGAPWRGGAQFGLADGSVRFLNNNVAPEVLQALSTPNGGEALPEDY